jgi:hypothetical protein
VLLAPHGVPLAPPWGETHGVTDGTVAYQMMVVGSRV